jgi:hypothetical protein
LAALEEMQRAAEDDLRKIEARMETVAQLERPRRDAGALREYERRGPRHPHA